QRLLVQHRRALLELVQTICPDCGEVDYLPLTGGWRRCWACGTRWGPGRDPGDPSRLERTAGLPGLELRPESVPVDRTARRPGWSIGSVLRCPCCGNRAYSTPIGAPDRRCDGPDGCGQTWNPESSSSRAGS